MADIFISYANEDRDKAGELARVLEQRQWTVWWDREIALGLSFDEVIERELLACRCVIVLWTAQSVASRWVKREARSAARREVLVPILAENVEPPLEFTDLQAANLTAWEHFADHAEFDKVVRRIEELVPRAQAGAAPSRRVVRAAADADRIRDAPVHLETRWTSWFDWQRVRVGAIAAAALVVGMMLAFYLSTRPAPSSPPVSKDGGEVVKPGPPPVDPPPTDLGASTDQPKTRTVNLPGFRSSISQAGYFSSKEFEIDGLNLARNFLISFDVKSTRTEGSTRYGIAWNFQPDDFLLFTLHSIGPGAYSIGAGRSPNSPFVRFSQGSLDINAERDFDVLQMSKRGNALIFSVNRREVWRTTVYKLQSNRFAFWVADFSDAVMRSYTVQQ